MRRTSLDLDIQISRIAYPTVTETPYSALNHRFCAIGNGYEWVRAENGEDYQCPIEELHENDADRDVARNYLLNGVVPQWPFDELAYMHGVYSRQDVIELDNGRVTWDHIAKPNHYRPIHEFSLIHELTTGVEAFSNADRPLNPSRDLVEGALVVCDLILELGILNFDKQNDVDFESKQSDNINNHKAVRACKPQIVERYYGPGVHTYLVQITEEDYNALGTPLESALEEAMTSNIAVDPAVNVSHNGNWVTIWPEGSAGYHGLAYVPDELLEQIADKRQVTWLLVFYDSSKANKDTIKASNSTVMIPYLSDLVVRESYSYQQDQARAELSSFAYEEDGCAKRWITMTPEEREADCRLMRQKYLLAHEQLDQDGKRFIAEIEHERAIRVIPDPDVALNEYNRKMSLTDEERAQEEAIRAQRISDFLKGLKSGE